MGAAHPDWPPLDFVHFRETGETLQLWTQVVGKTRLALSPWLNHSWHVPLYVTARGLSTAIVHHDGKALDVEFDLVDHQLRLRVSDGGARDLPLAGGPVADFHARFLGAMQVLGVPTTIDGVPNELSDPVPFAEDLAPRVYDPGQAQSFWRALLQAHRLLADFRTGFVGKASPVHFFWGSFDLAVTRFSGRRAPPHPGGVPHLPDAVAREAYSHEVSSAGFWPGNAASPQAAFYAYAYPEPPGLRDARVEPAAARWDVALGEFLLPYEAVRTAGDPDATVMAFLQSTYAAAADAAGWDRAALECAVGEPRVVRAT